ncbi:hypothetical protein [Ottowia sp. oral taxon 894]|uniref:hypothetical protein n=1 Tax=Ottowia sp. oral taxon 894 TaxID=1658672 RepID=UPI0012E32194|nr:hypothetical protein [Ottowia sp. oral taxon 894]
MQRMLWAMLLALACCGAAAKGKKAHFYYPRLEGTYVMVKSIPPPTDDAEISDSTFFEGQKISFVRHDDFLNIIRTPGRKEAITRCCFIRHFPTRCAARQLGITGAGMNIGECRRISYREISALLSMTLTMMTWRPSASY